MTNEILSGIKYEAIKYLLTYLLNTYCHLNTLSPSTCIYSRTLVTVYSSRERRSYWQLGQTVQVPARPVPTNFMLYPSLLPHDAMLARCLQWLESVRPSVARRSCIETVEHAIDGEHRVFWRQTSWRKSNGVTRKSGIKYRIHVGSKKMRLSINCLPHLGNIYYRKWTGSLFAVYAKRIIIRRRF